MFKGSGTALVTPFKNGKVDEKALRNLIDFQIENGTDFVVPVGTTGESSTLSHDEHIEVIRITVDQVAKRVPVLAGAGSNSTLEAIHLTEAAAKLGVQGTLQICPYYNKPTQAGIIAHFEAITQAVNLPIIVYNIKGRTGINIELPTIVHLSKVPNIVGIKEANGSIVAVSDILENCKNFLVLSGEDSITFPMLALGAHGAISVTSNVLPKLCAQMWDAVCQSNFEKAREIHYQLAAMNRILFIETNPIPVKTALSLMKKLNLEFRLPLVNLQPNHLEQLKTVLISYHLIT